MTKEKSIILIVDDNKENLKVVSNYLKKEGYQIALSLNTEGAANVLVQNELDLILLDVMMPDEDGYTFCKRLKNDDKLKEIPVIFLTAMNDTENLVEGFKAGGVDYITKPFRKEELLARVKSHVELSKAKKNIMEQAEVIKQINMTRDRMYSIISHDIKSPFANISMMISMIAEEYLDPQSDDFWEIIHNLNYSTKETYNLLDNLLNWTRSQTGNLICIPEKIPLPELVENAIPFARFNAINKNVSINIDVPDDIYIHADPNMMKCVIRNLLSNAVKYTENNGEIFLTASSEPDNSVVIEVRDTGIGIEKEHLENLFSDHSFYSTAGTNNEKGSGLGLHLIRDFTEVNKGVIEVYSEPGKGTTFILKLPTVKE